MITQFCGDCVAAMRQEVPDASVQQIVTSPPYDKIRSYSIDQRVVWRDDISSEEKAQTIEELIRLGIAPEP